MQTGIAGLYDKHTFGVRVYLWTEEKKQVQMQSDKHRIYDRMPGWAKNRKTPRSSQISHRIVCMPIYTSVYI